MLHIAICDDELMIAEKIKGVVVRKMKDLGEEFEIAINSSGKDLLLELETTPADLILLDIDMPEMSGIDVASRLYEKGKNESIIFVTSHSSLVFESLQYHPFQFIRKEHMIEELPQVLDNFMSIYHRNNKVLEITDDEGTHVISIFYILYIERIDRKVSVICRNGEKHDIYLTLKELERDYLVNGLCRIHNGIIVNLKYVADIENTNVTLDDGTKLPLSRTRKKWVRQQYMKYMRAL